MDKFINQRVIVRANGAGVFYGTLKAKFGEAADELAQAGCSKDSQITRAAEEVIVENVLEIHPCTEAAVASIERVPVWKYR